MDRRQLLKYTAAMASVGLVVAVAGRRSVAAGNAQVIRVTAQRFRFVPDEIMLKSGEPAVLEITSLDFVHGFKVPDLGIRMDLVPGRIIPVVIKPLAPGRYVFLCDNFCGSGHEEMNGAIVVTT